MFESRHCVRSLMLIIAVIGAMACRQPQPAAPRSPASAGACLGYACTAAGARQMLDETARELDPELLTPAARKQLDALLTEAVATMEREAALTPEGFRRAQGSFRRFLDALPRGVEDPVPRAIEKVRTKRFSLCPLWPFC